MQYWFIVYWRNLVVVGNTIHMLNNSGSFLAECISKAEMIGMAGWTNTIEVLVVAFQSIVGPLK